MEVLERLIMSFYLCFLKIILQELFNGYFGVTWEKRTHTHTHSKYEKIILFEILIKMIVSN